MDDIIIGDFDFTITNIELVHKFHYIKNNIYRIYANGRKIAGIVYCIQGEAEYIFQNNKTTLQAGDMILLSENATYEVDVKEDFHHITINFNLQTKDYYLSKLNGYADDTTYKIASDTFDAGEFLEKILNIWEEKKVGFRIHIKALLYELLYKYFIYMQKEKRSSIYFKIRPAKQILDTRYSENIPISELAKACGFSESYFRHTFTKVFHCSPTEYRFEKRILKAKDLLLAGELSVSEVAAAVGFTDANYFSRIFKKYEHISPSSYGSSPVF